MFSLTLREQFLVTGVLLALVTGAAVKHWRDARRASAPVVVEAGTHPQTSGR